MPQNNSSLLNMTLNSLDVNDGCVPFDGKLERLYRIKKGHFSVLSFLSQFGLIRIYQIT